MDKIQEAIDMASKLSHPQSLAFAHIFAARHHHFRREAEKMLESAEAAIALSVEQGLPQTLAWGTVMRGWALTEGGNTQEGIAQIRESLAAQRAMGAQVSRPTFLAMLAEAYQKTGQIDEALAVLDEALTDIESTGERFHEAEIYRLKGKSLLIRAADGSDQRSDAETAMTGVGEPSVIAEAEGCFNQAVKIARRQRARSLELRAVMSMSRLWQRQDKKTEVRQMLTEITTGLPKALTRRI